MEPQFPNLPVQVPWVRLAELVGLLGEQADQEVDPAEVSI